MKVKIELTVEQEKEPIIFEISEPFIIPFTTASFFTIGGETYLLGAIYYDSKNKVYLLKGKRL